MASARPGILIQKTTRSKKVVLIWYCEDGSGSTYKFLSRHLALLALRLNIIQAL